MRTLIDDLPSCLLGKVFSYVGVRRQDVIAVLTVCKRWYQAARQDCPAWWDTLLLDWRKLGPALEEGGHVARSGFLAGFAQRAGKLRRLALMAGEGQLREDVPQLLGMLVHGAGTGAPLLASLHLNMLFSQPGRLEACCLVRTRVAVQRPGITRSARADCVCACCVLRSVRKRLGYARALHGWIPACFTVPFALCLPPWLCEWDALGAAAGHWATNKPTQAETRLPPHAR
jgi:hypothetical protein